MKLFYLSLSRKLWPILSAFHFGYEITSSMFKEIYSRAINYGAAGSLIGHEIMHGFDDQGAFIDLPSSDKMSVVQGVNSTRMAISTIGGVKQPRNNSTTENNASLTNTVHFLFPILVYT